MVAIFGGKWWLLVDYFGMILGTQNTETNVWKMEYDEFFII